MKFTIVLLIVAFVASAIAAGEKSDKFSFIYKNDDGVKLGCYGSTKVGAFKITHYIVDGKGFRKVLENPNAPPTTFRISTKSGMNLRAGFRPNNDETELFFPDECFV